MTATSTETRALHLAQWLRDFPSRHGIALPLEELGHLGEAVYLLERFSIPAAWMMRCITNGLIEQAEPHQQSNSADWTDAFPVFTTCPRLVPDHIPNASKMIETEDDAMQLAEEVGLIGPRSRVGDSHNATRRFACALLARASAPAAVKPEPMTDEQVDAHLDAILRSAGSALRHYTMQKSKDDMRAALRAAITKAGEV